MNKNNVFILQLKTFVLLFFIKKKINWIATKHQCMHEINFDDKMG